MTQVSDFRDLLAQLTVKCAQTWGLSDTVAPGAVREATMLADEATLLHVAESGFGKGKDSWLPNLVSGLDTEAMREAIASQGQQWRVGTITEAATRALSDIRQSLEAHWSPARAGMVLRALPVLAGSRANPLGKTLGYLLGVEALPQDLMTAYADAFRRKDLKLLADVDMAITSDQSIGMLAMEMASRLLGQLGGEADRVHKSASDRLVSCLASLIRDVTKDSQAEGDN